MSIQCEISMRSHHRCHPNDEVPGFAIYVAQDSVNFTSSCFVQEQMKQRCFTCGPQLHLHWLRCCSDCRGASLAAAARAQLDMRIRSSTRFSRTCPPAFAGCCSHLQTRRLGTCTCSTSSQSRQRCRYDHLSLRLHYRLGWGRLCASCLGCMV